MACHQTIARRAVLWMVAAAAAFIATPASADDAKPTPVLPPGVVARVMGQDLTYDAFARLLVQHVQQDLLRARHGPRAVLDQMLEERLVFDLCKARGLEVTTDDVLAKEGDLARDIRVQSGGSKTLADLIRDEGTTLEQFRVLLAHELRRERLANQRLGGTLPDDPHLRLNQVKLVIAKLMQEAKIEVALPVVDRPVPDVLEPGVVARIEGATISHLDFGRRLAERLPGEDVRGFLDKECKIGLMVAQGVALDDAGLADEIERMRKLWPLERTLQREAEWLDVRFEDRFQTLFQMDVADVAQSRFYRGLFGLIRKMRADVTEADLREEFEKGRKGRYGPHILATDIKIGFSQDNNPFGGRNSRTLREALAIAWKHLGELNGGKSFEKLASDVRANKQDPTHTVLRVRLYDVGPDLRLYEEAVQVAVGDYTRRPVETLADVHIMRNEGPQPGRSFEEVREFLRDIRSRQKAREWLETHTADPQYVIMRWPLPR